MGEIVDRGFPFFFHFFCRALNRLTEQPMGVTSLTDGFHQHTHNQPKKAANESGPVPTALNTPQSL